MKIIHIFLGVLFVMMVASCTPVHRPLTSSKLPPAPTREVRGAWIATVGNIDWPSKPGLSAEKQQAEAIAILDRMAALHMNVAIFQVRTSCDAFYESKLEPWSYFLTGQQGKSPGYDPLAFWIAEAHKRGIELHAWINPFRAMQYGMHYENSAAHVSHTHPDWVLKYTDNDKTLLWLDPGNPEAVQHSYDVVMDIVRRYDVDGIHIDDYFYPYPLHDKNDDIIPFPDGGSYAKYWQAGGRMKLDDWRRSNINHFIQRMYAGIHAEKKWVKFGISPFGIWRPEYPASVGGFDGYAEIYCDSRLWLRKGWLDYMVPQLYWKISAPKQSYLELLEWWLKEDRYHRPMCAGLYTSLLDEKWTRDEIGDEIGIARNLHAAGTVHFSMKALLDDSGNINDLLVNQPPKPGKNKKKKEEPKAKDGLYEQAALVQPSPWLDGPAPAKPSAQAQRDSGSQAVTAHWQPTGDKPVWQWAVQTKVGNEWNMYVYPAQTTEATFKKERKKLPVSMVVVRAVDRCGVTSEPVVIQVEK